MPIQLVKEDEKLIYKDSGSTIFYRRISSAKRAEIIKKHTVRGKTDWQAATAELMEYIVLGWEKVQESKVDIPFSKDLIPSLPENYQTELLALSGGAGDEEAEKN